MGCFHKLFVWIECTFLKLEQKHFSSLPICAPSAEEVLSAACGAPSHIVQLNSCKDPVLEDCLVPQCSEKNSSETCEGIIGCYWCENNKDDIPLKKAYCASADVCFKGKEGIRDESSFRIVQPKKMVKKP